MKNPTTPAVQQDFVAEEVQPGLFRLFTSRDYRPARGFRYRVISAATDIWQAIFSFGAAHRNEQGLITREQLQQFLNEQRTHCEIEEISP